MIFLRRRVLFKKILVSQKSGIERLFSMGFQVLLLCICGVRTGARLTPLEWVSIIQYKGAFDSIATYIESDNGKEQVEVWFARDLQNVLGYARWENFLTAINRAVESCKSQNINVDDHFREVTKMIKLAKGAEREIKDYMLTRYAWAARYSS